MNNISAATKGEHRKSSEVGSEVDSGDKMLSNDRPGLKESLSGDDCEDLLPRKGLAIETARCQPMKREITISPLDYGYIVKVGCQTFAIESDETLIENLAEYLRDPSKKERAWLSSHSLKNKGE